jgi:F-type H+-transporting ATPase subunit epsilon
VHVTLVSPERSLYDGEADALIAPAFDGLVGILPRHAPFMTLLGEGVLTVRQQGKETRFRVSGGFLQVIRQPADTVRIVTDRVTEFS